MLPEISVIVPAYRAAESIAACVASLRAQSGAPAFEVLVVDSSPDEATSAAVRAANPPGPAQIELRVERSPRRLYPGSARNLGARLARGGWLLFLDADCLAAPDLLAQAAALRGAGASVVGGSIARAGTGAVSARVRHLLEFKESLPGVPARSTWTLASACLLFDSATFARHGGFPDTRAAEDWLLDWRMWQSGEPMRFDPRLRVGHLTAAGWRPLVRYMRLLGRASGAARRVGGLPGQSLVRWPVLAAALPFGRTARALAWCARYAPRELAFLLVAWPAYFAMAAVWAAGFYEGVRSPAETARLAVEAKRE